MKLKRYGDDSTKTFLQQWAQENSVSPSTLSERTGLSYQHCWGLLSGSHPLTFYTLAILLVSLGESGPAVELAKAMRPQWLQKRLEQMEVDK